MPNKTIYLRPDDVLVWEEARELAGDRLSPVIVEALRHYIEQRRVEIEQHDRTEYERLKQKYEKGA